jgi:uncharacterized membrane protein
VNLLGRRRRVRWDHLAGALWVLPTLSVVAFLLGQVERETRPVLDAALRLLGADPSAALAERPV